MDNFITFEESIKKLIILQKLKYSSFIVGTMRIGSWGQQMSDQEIQKFIEGCLELGLNDFDHADIYGSYTTEGEFGNVLRQCPSLRSQIRITTKCGIKLVSKERPSHTIKSYDLSPNHIIASVENSLKNFNTDYIDTLLLHRPDYLFDAQSISETFRELHKQGKVRHFGVSNFTASQFDLLHKHYDLCTNQIEISLMQREAFENGTLDQMQKHNITPSAWSPLGGGVLLKASEDDRIKHIQETINTLAKRYTASTDQILYAWLKKHPSGIIPVLGTSKLERIKNAVDSIDIHLTHEEWYMLWQAATGKEID